MGNGGAELPDHSGRGADTGEQPLQQAADLLPASDVARGLLQVKRDHVFKAWGEPAERRGPATIRTEQLGVQALVGLGRIHHRAPWAAGLVGGCGTAARHLGLQRLGHDRLNTRWHSIDEAQRPVARVHCVALLGEALKILHQTLDVRELHLHPSAGAQGRAMHQGQCVNGIEAVEEVDEGVPDGTGAQPIPGHVHEVVRCGRHIQLQLLDEVLRCHLPGQAADHERGPALAAGNVSGRGSHLAFGCQPLANATV
mmetsp:Transcript_120770/g.348962  ORF Transcript_120770/g.348962 Transcript_120770/m.348962 type:complete len:255 (+) Transcript_120770:142-906(+)